MKIKCYFFSILIFAFVIEKSSAANIYSWIRNIIRTELEKDIQQYDDENGNEIYSEPINYEIECGVSNYSFTDRIVGGEMAYKNEFPWLVSLQLLVNKNYYHNCGGSIVNSQFILTAGHCIHGASKNLLLVKAGKYNLNEIEENEQSRNVSKIFTYSYNSETFEKDIALLKLNKPLDLKLSIVGPGCLPRGNETFEEHAVSIGWGRTKENGNLPKVLRKVTLTLLPKSECRELYLEKGYNKYLHNCQICTLEENKDACQGDSGGPLMCYNELDQKPYICGVVSWGVGCARQNFPGVFTEVSCFTGKLIETIDENKNILNDQ